jgi:sulfite exporter TauE/SafE
MFKIALGLFISGLLFGSGPCIASCGPILISYIAGTKTNLLKGLKDYILFSLARISVYIILGLIIFFLGSFTLQRLLGDYSKYIFILGGSFIILIGLLMVLGKRLEFRFLRFFHKNILERDKKSMILLGAVIGFLPCAPLLAILSYTGLVSKSWIDSSLYNFSFGIGTFVSPLILLAMLAGLIPRFLAKEKAAYSRIFSLICGLVIIFFGVQLIIRAI